MIYYAGIGIKIWHHKLSSAWNFLTIQGLEYTFDILQMVYYAELRIHIWKIKNQLFSIVQKTFEGLSIQNYIFWYKNVISFVKWLLIVRWIQKIWFLYIAFELKEIICYFRFYFQIYLTMIPKIYRALYFYIIKI